MRRFHKILSGITAAALVFGSLTAFADTNDPVVDETVLTTEPETVDETETETDENEGIDLHDDGDGDGDGDETEVTVTTADQLAATVAGKTYKLDADVELTAGITISAANVTLDLNGHKLTDNTGAGIGITVNGGSLIIQDTSANADGVIYRENGVGTNYLINVTGTNSTLTFKSGKLENKYAGSVTVIHVTPSCTLNVEGGELKSTTGSTLIFADDGNGQNVTFNMTGGTLISDCSGPNVRDTSLPIPAGNDPVEGASYAGALINFGTATISGGTIKGVVWANSYKYDSVTNISGTADIEGYLHIGSDQSGKDETKIPKINVSGGTLNVSVLEVDAVAGPNNDGAGELNITGGTVNIAKFVLPADAEPEMGLTVSEAAAANFTTADKTNAEKLLPEDTVLVENADGTFGPGSTLTDEATEITVTAAAGAIPAGTVLKVVPGADDPDDEASYDITLEDASGHAVQPTKALTVSIPVPEKLEANKNILGVFYKSGDNSYTNMGATLNGNNLVFKTDHFSTYVVTAKNLAPKGSFGGVATGGIISYAPKDDTSSSDSTSSDNTSSDNTSSDSTPSSSDSSSATSEPTSSDNGGSSVGNGGNGDNNSNPGTGIALGFFPVALCAGAAIALSKKRK